MTAWYTYHPHAATWTLSSTRDAAQWAASGGLVSLGRPEGRVAAMATVMPRRGF